MGNTAGKLSEKATRNPPGKPPEISYGRAILQPTIYNLSTVARQGPEKQSAASGNILRKLHGKHRREAVTVNPPNTRRENRRKSHMDAPSSSPPSTIYQQTPGEALKNSRKPPGIASENSMGKTIGKLTDKSTRNPPGTTGKTPGRPSEIPPGKPFCASHPAPVRARPAPIFPYASAPPFPFHLSIYPHPITHRQSTPSPRSWGLGASTQRQRLAALRPPLLTGWVCVCMEPKHPVSQNAAGGKPLLVGLPPSTPTTTPFGTKRRTPAPCSWGGRSSTSRQRHWPAALRPFVIFSSRHLPFPAHMNVVYS